MTVVDKNIAIITSCLFCTRKEPVLQVRMLTGVDISICRACIKELYNAR